jgi:hypothetical protein
MAAEQISLTGCAKLESAAQNENNRKNAYFSVDITIGCEISAAQQK